MWNSDSENQIINPVLFICAVFFPIMHNLILINLESQFNKIYLLISMFLLLISLIKVIKKKSLQFNKCIKVIIYIVVFITIQSIVTFFTADNLHPLSYLVRFVFPISVFIFLSTIQKLTVNRFDVNKNTYVIILIIYIFINILCFYLEYSENPIYIKYILGKYYEVSKGMRFGNIRFSGIFCWPNAFAYSSGSLYIMLDKFKTLRKLRFWLLPLIFLSGNRTVMIALLLLEFLTVISDKGKSTIRRILVIILGVLLLVFTSKSYFYDLAISINSEILAYSSDNYRISVLKQSFEIFKEHWLFGIGLDRFSALAVSIKNADYLVNNHLANLNIILATSDTFYTIICEVGTLGIVLWSLGIYRIFKLNKIIIGKFVLFILIVGYSDSNPLSNYYTIISYLIIIISVIKDSIKLSNVGESS